MRNIEIPFDIQELMKLMDQADSPSDITEHINSIKNALGITIPEAFAEETENRTLIRRTRKGMENNETFECSAFASEFITAEMVAPLGSIAGQYLRTEPLLKKEELRKEWRDSFKIIYMDRVMLTPPMYFSLKLIALMAYCANRGSEYAKKCLVYLYKAFHKKEYNSLKRQKILSWDSLCSIGGTRITRVYLMAKYLGINYEDEFQAAPLAGLWDFIKRRSGSKPENAAETFCRDQMPPMDEQKIEERKEYFREKFPELEDVYFNASPEIEKGPHGIADGIISNVLRMTGCSKEAILGEMDGDGENIDYDYDGAAALAHVITPDKTDGWTEDEAVLYAYIAELSCKIGKLCAYLDHLTSEILSIWPQALIQGEEKDIPTEKDSEKWIQQYVDFQIGRSNYYEQLFLPKEGRSQKVIAEFLRLSDDLNAQALNEETPPKEEQPDQSSRSEEIAALKEELADLKIQLTNSEGLKKHYREVYKNSIKKLGKYKKRLEKANADYKETVALRSFVYNLVSEDVAEEPRIPEEEMVNTLREQKVVLIGGNQNWVKKIKQLFPSWSYLEPDRGCGWSTDVVKKAKHIVFFTDTLSHSTYSKFLGAAIREEVPFGYLSGVNLSRNIVDLYEQICGSP